MRFDIGTLDSGERSLPFGLLVKYLIYWYSLLRFARDIDVTLRYQVAAFHAFFSTLFLISERIKSYCLIVFILQYVFKAIFFLVDTVDWDFNNLLMTR